MGLMSWLAKRYMKRANRMMGRQFPCTGCEFKGPMIAYFTHRVDPRNSNECEVVRNTPLAEQWGTAVMLLHWGVPLSDDLLGELASRSVDTDDVPPFIDSTKLSGTDELADETPIDVVRAWDTGHDQSEDAALLK